MEWLVDEENDGVLGRQLRAKATGGSKGGGGNYRSPAGASSQRKLYARGRRGSVGQVARRAASRAGKAAKAKSGGAFAGRVRPFLKNNQDMRPTMKDASRKRVVGAIYGKRGARARKAAQPAANARVR